MKIKLEKAYGILETASAIIIGENILAYPCLSKIESSDENEFLYFSWDDGRNEYSLRFCEGDNPEVEVIGTSMFLYDTDANDDSDYTQITILVSQNLEGE